MFEASEVFAEIIREEEDFESRCARIAFWLIHNPQEEFVLKENFGDETSKIRLSIEKCIVDIEGSPFTEIVSGINVAKLYTQNKEFLSEAGMLFDDEVWGGIKGDDGISNLVRYPFPSKDILKNAIREMYLEKLPEGLRYEVIISPVGEAPFTRAVRTMVYMKESKGSFMKKNEKNIRNASPLFIEGNKNGEIMRIAFGEGYCANSLVEFKNGRFQFAQEEGSNLSHEQEVDISKQTSMPGFKLDVIVVQEKQIEGGISLTFQGEVDNKERIDSEIQKGNPGACAGDYFKSKDFCMAHALVMMQWLAMNTNMDGDSNEKGKVLCLTDGKMSNGVWCGAYKSQNGDLYFLSLEWCPEPDCWFRLSRNENVSDSPNIGGMVLVKNT